MKVALTGGSGFIGGYIARELTEQGHQVRAQVRPASDDLWLRELGAELVTADLEDVDSLARLVRGCDAVIHNGLHRCPGGETDNIRFNVGGSLELLHQCLEHEVGQFLFVSTCVVHSKILEDRPLDEAHPLWTSSTYGAYKAAIEAFIPAYHGKYGLNTSAWRPSEVYGIRRKLEDSNWYDIIRTVKRGQRVEDAYGGKIVAVEDVASAIVGGLGREAVAGEVFNLTDCHIYRQDVAEYTREITGSDSEIAKVKGSGPKHQIVTKKAEALGLFKPRGHEGVKGHIKRILELC